MIRFVAFVQHLKMIKQNVSFAKHCKQNIIIFNKAVVLILMHLFLSRKKFI